MNSQRPIATAFEFKGRQIDVERQSISLIYTAPPHGEFREEFRFPAAPTTLSEGRMVALTRAVELLHQIAGVSYYKAFVPPTIRFRGSAPSRPRAAFLDRLYVHGLGEFAYENGMSLQGRIRFPHGDDAPTASAIDWPARVAVPVGGGKDSIVSLELAKDLGMPVAALQVGDSKLIQDVIRVSGVPRIHIQRKLSLRLRELNAQGALNGHVPVTAVLSAAFLVAAIWHGFDRVVMSNERSANAENLIDADGLPINHQYSKSLDFERAFRAEVEREVITGWNYFSVLRPLSELGIARLFARSRAYFDNFSSCNRNFHVDGSRIDGRWCRDCPKCRFVFLALANFVPRPELIEIFGGNLLDDVEQAAGFDALIGYGAAKPFECVGETTESHAALDALSRKPDWCDDAVIRRYQNEVSPQLPAAPSLDSQLELASDHVVPTEWVAALERACNA